MLTSQLAVIDTYSTALALDEIAVRVTAAGYMIVERNDAKPWGGYLRLESNDADKFIQDFFPGLTAHEARLGNDAADLSPKFLYILPSQRLSWQLHHRRAERWVFLTEGAYYKSTIDDHGELIRAQAGHVVQFGREERHRLVGADDRPTLVAEIWQHTDPAQLSDEDDIVRLADDYQR